jgi:hypothetical protein
MNDDARFGGSLAYAVVLALANGERLTVATCESAEEAEQQAERLIAELDAAAPAEWPRFGSMRVRPSAVVAVEVAEEHQRSWGGSTARSRWGTTSESAA